MGRRGWDGSAWVSLGLGAWVGREGEMGQHGSVAWGRELGQWGVEEERKKKEREKDDELAMVSFGGGSERMMNWWQRGEFAEYEWEVRVWTEKVRNDWNRVVEKRNRKNNNNNILMWGGNKKLFFSLALSYSVHPYIAMHCSCVGKTFTYTTTNVTHFLYMVVLKIVF